MFKEPNKVGGQYEWSIAASPLIGVNGELDLLYFAQFIPPVGTFIKSIDRLSDAVSLITFGSTNVDYFLNLGVSCNLKIKFNRLLYHTIDGYDSTNSEMMATANIAFFIKAGFNLKIELTSGQLGANGKVEGRAKVEVQFFDNKKENIQSGVQFKGLDVNVTLSLSAKKKDSLEEINANKSKDNDLVNSTIQLLGESKPWKIEFNIF